MAVYVTNTSQVGGDVVQADDAFSIAWTAAADVVGPQLASMRVQVWLQSDATQTPIVDDSAAVSSYSAQRTRTIASGTLAANTAYVIRVSAQDVGGNVGYVDTVVTALPITALPTITAPAAGASLTSPTVTVTWTLSPTTQLQYQVRVTQGVSTVVFDSGNVTSSAKTVPGIPIPATGTYAVDVRARRSTAHAWSNFARRTFSTTVTAPATPTISSLVATDVGGIGLKHALVATITQPTPSGGQPAVATTEVYVRRSTDPGTGTLVETVAGAATSYTWTAPTSGVTWQMRVRVVAVDGRSTFSAWVTANEALALRGVVLYAVSAAASVRLFRFNGDEAEDDYQPERELIRYDGREFPVVEFGTSSTRTLTVELSMKTDADRDNLRALLLSRSVVLYRDRRGRKVYGMLEHDGLKDTIYGYATTITLQAVDYPLDRAV